MAASSSCVIKLIVGLGNPGAQYAHTRHNVGYDLLCRIADDYRISLNPEPKFQGLTGRGSIADQDVRLLFPTTFMNESGRAVGAICTFYKIMPEEVLVIHDELDLAPGYMKFKLGGGNAGHNGLKSITACLGSNPNFYRLRLGIGKAPGRDTINWVLGRPDSLDQNLIDDAGTAALKALVVLLKQGVSRGTALINGYKPQTGDN